MNQLYSDYVLICLPDEVVTVESEVVMVTVVVAAEPLVVVGVCVTFKRIIDSCAYVSVLPLIDENCFSIYFLKVNLSKPLHEFSLLSLPPFPPCSGLLLPPYIVEPPILWRCCWTSPCWLPPTASEISPSSPPTLPPSFSPNNLLSLVSNLALKKYPKFTKVTASPF